MEKSVKQSTAAEPGTGFSQSFLLVVLVLAVVGGLTFVNYQFSVSQPGGNDFLARWTGAHYWLAKGVNPYAPEVSLAAQQYIYGRAAQPEQGEDIAHFVYPLPSMLFFAPFGLLPYTAARAVWMTLLELGLPLLVLLSLRLFAWRPGRPLQFSFLVFSLLWYHGMRAVIVGQFAVLEALIILAAFMFYMEGRDGLAGIFLALSVAKPQMAVLFIPFLGLHALVKRRWRMLLFAGLTCAFLLLVSELLLPGWMLDWYQQLRDYPSYTAIGSPVSILAGFFPQWARIIDTLLSALLGMGMLWAWRCSCRGGEEMARWAAMVTLVVTNLIVVRTATTNYVILLPVLLYMARGWILRDPRCGRIGTYALMITLLIGVWWLFLTTVDGNVEGIAPYLPLPILTLLGVMTSPQARVCLSRKQANAPSGSGSKAS